MKVIPEFNPDLYPDPDPSLVLIKIAIMTVTKIVLKIRHVEDGII